ncbi:hypothetical protein VMCG_07151 [Cytospora schulzeri]|uniref:Heterokaryon incompatibility domain-containing protein n=1 Tax=Cytospora schulzeri TaxID=448051 RepID=A0A423W4U3_9PEZI|nr:hypothetical protein VMCG_07151 [Valsa malicola]
MAEELAVFRDILASDYEGPSQLESFAVVPPPSGYSTLQPTTHITTDTQESWSTSSGAVDPPGIENWPRRLLQLTSPVWTSHEWQPGHIYGGHREPKYNAISYTWGRFRLDSAEASKAVRRSKKLCQVRGISIDGCPWTIPPIHPARFTVDEFRQALERTSEIDGDSSGKFVWLDVACIDQESEAGQLEVGRQADIFRGAQKVSVWLTDFSLTELEKAFSSIRSDLVTVRAFQSMPDRYLELTENIESWKMGSTERMEENVEVLNTMTSTLDKICKDPWFSSLWTLQEAFLCPEARFLSRDGHFVGSDSVAIGNLSQLTLICERTRVITEDLLKAFEVDTLKGLTWMKRCLEIGHLVKAKGLAALHSRNPIVLYSTAGKRTAKKDYDYIYAIQQVFGFRLGNSRPGDAGRVYSRLELQMQLGADLLEKYPVQSQMHIFDEPVEDQMGWCISLASRLPGHRIPQDVPGMVNETGLKFE